MEENSSISSREDGNEGALKKRKIEDDPVAIVQDDQAVESDDDNDNVDDDKKKTSKKQKDKKKKKKIQKDEEEEEEDDDDDDDDDESEDENEYDMNDPFIARDDEVEEELGGANKDDASSASGDEDDGAEEEEEEDSGGLRRLRKNKLDEDDLDVIDGGGNDENRLERQIEDPYNDEGRDHSGDEDVDDADDQEGDKFIVDDDDDDDIEKPRRKSRTIRVETAADRFLSAGGYIEEKDEEEEEELEGEERVRSQESFLGESFVNPDELAQNYATKKDKELQEADEPERLQILKSQFPPLDRDFTDDELNERAEWVIEQINYDRVQAFNYLPRLSSSSHLPMVRSALEHLVNRQQEVMFVHTYRSPDIDGLSLDDLWEISHYGFRHRRFVRECDKLVDLIMEIVPEDLPAEYEGFFDADANKPDSLPSLRQQWLNKLNQARSNLRIENLRLMKQSLTMRFSHNPNTLNSIIAMSQDITLNETRINVSQYDDDDEEEEEEEDNDDEDEDEQGEHGNNNNNDDDDDDKKRTPSKKSKKSKSKDKSLIDTPSQQPSAAILKAKVQLRRNAVKHTKENVRLALNILTPSFVAIAVEKPYLSSSLPPQSVSPTNLANEIIAESAQLGTQLVTEASLCNEAVRVLGEMLFAEYSIRDFARITFRRFGELTTEPTQKGRFKVVEDPSSYREIYDVISLRRKPYHTFSNEYRISDERDSLIMILHIMDAKKQGLLKLTTNCTEKTGKIAREMMRAIVTKSLSSPTMIWLDSQDDWTLDLLQSENFTDTWDGLRFRAAYYAVHDCLLPWMENEMIHELTFIAQEHVARESAKALKRLVGHAPFTLPISNTQSSSSSYLEQFGTMMMQDSNNNNSMIMNSRDDPRDQEAMKQRSGAIIERAARTSDFIPPRDIRIMSIFASTESRTLSGIAIIGGFGEVLDHASIPSVSKFDGFKAAILSMIEQFAPHALLINSSCGLHARGILNFLCDEAAKRLSHYPSAGREPMKPDDDSRSQFIRDHHAGWFYPILVDDTAAKLFSRSKSCMNEFDGLSMELTCAIGMGRQIQDPLLLLSSLWEDPNVISVQNVSLLGLALHPADRFVPPKRRLDFYERELMNVSAFVGLDVNVISLNPHYESILQFLPGFGPRKAKNFVLNIRQTQRLLEKKADLGEFISQSVMNQINGFLVTTKVNSYSGYEANNNNNHHDEDEYANDFGVLDSCRIQMKDFKIAALLCDEVVRITRRMNGLRDKDVIMDLNGEGQFSSDATKVLEEAFERFKEFRERKGLSWNENRIANEFQLWFDSNRSIASSLQGILSPEYQSDDVFDENVISMFISTQESLFHRVGLILQVLRMIHELRYPFEDKRPPFKSFSIEKAFKLLCADAEGFIHPGSEVHATIEEMIHHHKYGGKVFAKLPNGLKAVFQFRDEFSGLDMMKEELLARYNWKEEHPARGYVDSIDYEKFIVILTPDRQQHDYVADSCWVRPLTSMEHRAQNLGMDPNRPKVPKRRINHVRYRNSTVEEVVKLLENEPVGSVYFRPSSKGFGFLSATWKCCDDPMLIQHVSIRESGKAKAPGSDKITDDRLSKTLYIEGDSSRTKYTELDELLALYFDPILLKIREATQFKYFLPLDEPSTVARIKQENSNNPGRMVYYLIRDLKNPPRLRIISVHFDKAHVERVIVTPHGFELVGEEGIISLTIEKLIDRYKNRIRSLTQGGGGGSSNNRGGSSNDYHHHSQHHSSSYRDNGYSSSQHHHHRSSNSGGGYHHSQRR